MSLHNLPDRLLQGLTAIHTTVPRTIAASSRNGHVKGKRASVAIIVRIRPSIVPTPDSPSTSSTTKPARHGTDRTARSSSYASLSHPQSASSLPGPSTTSPTLSSLNDFFSLPWVQSGTPEILYIKRATRNTDRWSAQVAFPGGRQEPDDEDSKYTAMRETWEEVGIDLAEKKEFMDIGRLDDREITTSLGKRLLMVLSPFVFLHTGTEAPIPDIQASEVASAHWVPLTHLLSPHVRWGDVCIDITSRITPRNKPVRWVLRMLTGNMHFKCILLPNEPILPSDSPGTPFDPVITSAERPPLSLWGLTLGMSLDLLSHMVSTEPTTPASQRNPTSFLPSRDQYDFSVPPTPSAFPPLLAPSMTSIFPTFSSPDINFFIWLFGARYRYLVRIWNERLRNRRPASPTASRYELSSASETSRTPRRNSLSGLSPHGGRVNYTGLALNQFYAAVRKALVAAVVLRATLVLGSTLAAVMWLVKRIKERRRLLKG